MCDSTTYPSPAANEPGTGNEHERRESDNNHTHAYRLVVTGKFRPTYHGPYATIGAAKSKRTRLRNEAERYNQLPNDYRIERTSGTWQEVPE